MRGRFVRSLNTMFLVLIPKKGGAEDLKDFRPVSLVGGLYKRQQRCWRTKSKECFPKVISHTQNAFVEGRQILDVVLITNEDVDSVLRSNKGAILCKLDLEKTYDHVH